MKFSSRLTLTALLCFIITLFVGGTLYKAHQYQQIIYKQLNFSMQLQLSVDALRSQLWLYQEFYDQIGLNELNIRQAELAQNLAQPFDWGPKQKQIIKNLNNLNTNIRVLISTQEINYQRTQKIQPEAARLFKAKYSMIIEEMTEDMFNLHQLTIQIARKLQQNLIIISGIFLLMLTTMVTAWSITTSFRFKTGIHILNKGIKDVAAGDLKSKVIDEAADELSDLSSSFNNMKQAINESTVQKDELSREVARQTQVLTEQQVQLRFLAEHDELTGIYNRRAFIKQIDIAIGRNLRSNEKAALLFLDLNKFKEINDTLGHETGDKVIIEIAKRLALSLRSTDIVGRIGGDEFVIWLDMITHFEDIEHKINLLLNNIKKPIIIGEHNLNVGASIGVSVLNQHGQTSHLLLSAADTAMYKAKADDNKDFYFADDTQME